jgi:UDP-N-acetylglucosamine:LPS N-acetylglucosamine transferase
MDGRQFMFRLLHAGYYAKKRGVPMYVYLGNSYMHAVWLVTYRRSDVTSLNNNGPVVFVVAPDLTITRHDVIRSNPSRRRR